MKEPVLVQVTGDEPGSIYKCLLLFSNESCLEAFVRDDAKYSPTGKHSILLRYESPKVLADGVRGMRRKDITHVVIDPDADGGDPIEIERLLHELSGKPAERN